MKNDSSITEPKSQKNYILPLACITAASLMGLATVLILLPAYADKRVDDSLKLLISEKELRDLLEPTK